MTTPDPKLEPPRWPNGPEICLAENLPSFASREEALAYHERENPHWEIVKLGRCRWCAGWHFLSKPRLTHEPVINSKL